MNSKGKYDFCRCVSVFIKGNALSANTKQKKRVIHISRFLEKILTNNKIYYERIS